MKDRGRFYFVIQLISTTTNSKNWKQTTPIDRKSPSSRNQKYLLYKHRLASWTVAPQHLTSNYSKPSIKP